MVMSKLMTKLKVKSFNVFIVNYLSWPTSNTFHCLPVSLNPHFEIYCSSL